MDYLASLHELPRCAHGYAAHFTLGLLDRFYKKDLTEEEGIDIIRKCIEELAIRLLVNRTGFVIKIVDKVCIHSHDHSHDFVERSTRDPDSRSSLGARESSNVTTRFWRSKSRECISISSPASESTYRTYEITLITIHPVY